MNNAFFSLIILSLSLCIYAQDKLSVEDCKKLIKDRNITELSKFLSVLPKKIRSNYTLAFKSESPQEATHENPRVIMFSESADLIFAFNGDPSQEGFGTLEIIEVQEKENPATRKKEKKFTFHKMIFEEDVKKRQTYLAQHPQVAEEIKKHEKYRPGKTCLECHQKDHPRPNWDSYNFWRNFYGGDDDGPAYTGSFDPDFQFKGYNPGVKTGLKRLTEEGKIEDKKLEEFIHRSKEHPIYSQLLNLKENYSLVISDGGSRRYRGKANITLTQNLSNQNFQIIIQEITQHPAYPYFKYLIMYMNACYPKLSLDDGLTAEEEAQLRELFPSEIFSSEFVKKFTEYKKVKGENENFFSFLLTFFRSWGLPSEQWSMNFNSKERGFATPLYDVFNFAYWLRQADPDLKQLKGKVDKELFYFYFTDEAQCKETLKKHLTAVSKLKDPKLFRSLFTKSKDHDDDCADCIQGKLKTDPLPVVIKNLNELSKKLEAAPVPASCITCHSGPMAEGPIYPFDKDATTLINFLTTSDNRMGKKFLDEMKSGRMPPQKETDKNVKAESLQNQKFMKFLEGLISQP